MKPPLTVEARVAEELRNWLASELEQLDASNTNQFAHHVVTILLHEDLDIEDEPLTAGDDFLQNIYSIRRGKTRDRQKKAAVQFLRSAVCCNDSDEAEIQGVVDELMVKIDETKNKMNRKTSKRSLLTPIAINVKTSSAQACNKSDGSEEERRYNEAFPSLASEESLSKESASRFNGDSIWNKSPPYGKENGRKKVKKKTEYFSRHCYMFTCQEEAQACSIARQVAALALAETSLPNAEAAEVFPSTLQDSSPSSFGDSSGCWKSAFRTVVLTKIFSPTVAPLQFKDKSTPLFADSVLKVFSPNIVNGTDLSSLNLAISIQALTFVEESHTSRLFHPIYDESNQHLFPKGMDYEEEETLDSKKADNEISKIFEASRHREERLRNKVQKTKKTKKITPFKQVNSEDDLENALQFPFHCGDFWHDIVEKGAIALYPDISVKEKLADEAVTSIGSNIDAQACITPAAATSCGDVGELSLLCLVALRKNFTLETMKSLVVNYIQSVMCKQGLTWSSGHILKGMVEQLLKRKENTLLLVKCNTSERRIKDNLDLDQVLEVCIETLAKFLSPEAIGPELLDQDPAMDQSFRAEQQAFGSSAHDYWQEEESFSCSGEIHDGQDQIKMNSAISPELELANSNSLYTSCSNILSGYTSSCSIDLESLHMEDLVCFNEEGATPSMSGFSPSFLDHIDLTYLDDFDNRGEPVKTPLTFTEEAFIWNDSTEPGELLDIWPLNTRSVKRQTFGHHATQVTEWHISSGCYMAPLQPVETSGLDVYDQQDIGYFSNEMRQVQWDNPWSVTEWDSICKELLAGFMVGSAAWPKRASPPNPFKPSLFTSCLSKEGSQFLQSAFVNSYFSSISMEPSVNLKGNTLAVDCSALEQLWLSKDIRKSYSEHVWLSQERQHSFAFGWNSSSYELVRGVTCSNWLENNCTLGLLCPFSHPSI